LARGRRFGDEQTWAMRRAKHRWGWQFAHGWYGVSVSSWRRWRCV
jgi:hypothetical protein